MCSPKEADNDEDSKECAKSLAAQEQLLLGCHGWKEGWTTDTWMARFMKLRADQADTKMVYIGYSHWATSSSLLQFRLEQVDKAE